MCIEHCISERGGFPQQPLNWQVGFHVVFIHTHVEGFDLDVEWPYKLKWANWAIMRQSVPWECSLRIVSSCDYFHGIIIMCWCIECLSCILRILNGYSLVPTSHLYVAITFPTLNWAHQLAHSRWNGHCSKYNHLIRGPSWHGWSLNIGRI